MFQIFPQPGFPKIHARVQARMYDALEMMRIVNQKITLAIGAYDEALDDEYSIDDSDMRECQATAQLYIALFQELLGGVRPTLPDRVFAFVLAHENRIPWSQAHLEGIIIGLEATDEALKDAMSLLDVAEIDDAWRLLAAARSGIRNYADWFGGTTTPFDDDELRAALLAGKPIQSSSSYRRDLLARSREALVDNPDGLDYMPASELKNRIRKIESAMLVAV